MQHKTCNIKCQGNEEVQAVILGLVPTRESRRNSQKLVDVYVTEKEKYFYKV